MENNNLDRSLDEILAERQQAKRGGGGRGRGSDNRNGSRRREKQEYPRDGVRKSFRDDAPRNLDSEWVHDKFEDVGGRRSAPRRRHSPDGFGDSRGTKLRVDNIHYELTEDDLDSLFNRIGPVAKLELRYDRAGRSEGTAFVTYESHQDAVKAVREYDRANAAGQPIRLTLLPNGPSGPSARRNPFDTAVVPGRPLAERITIPSNRSRSLSPTRGVNGEAGRRGTDRYRPGGRGSRSRSPLPNRRRDGGRRPGARREGGGGGNGGNGGNVGNVGRGGGSGEKGRGGGGGGGGGRPSRTKKTAEELDAEMADYFGGGEHQPPSEAAPVVNGDAVSVPLQPPIDDVDMIE